MYPDRDINLDERAFNELYLACKYKFIRIANSYLQDVDVAKDVVNDSFMYYWENRANIVPDTVPAAYILGIVKKKSLTHIRSQSIHRKATDSLRNTFLWEQKHNIGVPEDSEPTRRLFSQEVESIFREQLTRLPDVTRKVFLSSRNENLTHRQIADKHNLTGRQVVREMSRALSHLRTSLRDYLPGG
jgi:RNA polymerase sigma-70 factor (ECF subfamily)